MSASYISVTDRWVKHAEVRILKSLQTCRGHPTLLHYSYQTLLNTVLKMKCGRYKVLWSKVNLKTLILHFYQILNINYTYVGFSQSVVLLIHWQ